MTWRQTTDRPLHKPMMTQSREYMGPDHNVLNEQRINLAVSDMIRNTIKDFIARYCYYESHAPLKSEIFNASLSHISLKTVSGDLSLKWTRKNENMDI